MATKFPKKKSSSLARGPKKKSSKVRLILPGELAKKKSSRAYPGVARSGKKSAKAKPGHFKKSSRLRGGRS